MDDFGPSGHADDLFERFPDGLIRVSSEGHIEAHNARALELCAGLEALSAPRRWYELLDMESQREALSTWSLAKRQPGQWVSFQGRAHQSAPLEWRLMCAPDGSRLEVIVRDLSEPFEQLTRRKDRLRAVYEETPVMAHAIDGKGRLLMVSARWLQRMGYEREEVIGRPSTHFLSERSQRYAKEVVLPRYFETGQCHDVPYEMITRGGEILEVELSATAERDEHGAFARSFAVLIDVTERNRLMRRLKRQNAKLNAFFEALPDGALMSDTSQRVMRVNAHLREMFGYDRDELEGALVQVLYEDPEQSQREGISLETSCRRHDGSLFSASISNAPIVDDRGEVLGHLRLIRDVSEQRALARQSERQRQLTEAFFEAIPYATVIADTERRVVRANLATSKLFGYDQSELIGRQTEIFYATEELYEKEGEQFFNERISPHARLNTLTRFCQRDGGEFIGELIGAKIFNASGEVEGYLGLMRDMTEELQRERQLAEQNIALTQANKDLERFAYIASHDLQEPLRKISSFISMLEMEMEFSDTQALYFGYVKDAATRLQALIRDLLAYSRADDLPQLEACEPLHVLKRSLQDYEGQLQERSARVEILDESDGERVLSHESVLSQVFSNMISNAVKYAHPERALRLTVRYSRASPTHMKIAVEDNGLGIEPKFHKRVFEIFQRLHRRNEIKGQGIGLAICKKIIERQGGELQLESDGISGSLFWFTLKRAGASERPELLLK